MSNSLVSISISKNPPGLALSWSDGFKAVLSYETLRRECPCAPCQSENKTQEKNFRVNDPSLKLPSYQPSPEGVLDLKEVTRVGQYAVNLRWGDGHATGIYPDDYLRRLTEI